MSQHCLDAANLLDKWEVVKLVNWETPVWPDLACRPEIGRKTLFVVNTEPALFLHIFTSSALISFSAPGIYSNKESFLDSPLGGNPSLPSS